jgi:hypothetical protein
MSGRIGVDARSPGCARIDGVDPPGAAEYFGFAWAGQGDRALDGRAGIAYIHPYG